MKKVTLKNINKRKKKKTDTSSEEDNKEEDFAPEALRNMDVTKVGALGIDYLKSIESMRAKSRNLHGGISGKIRKNLQNTTDIINTLIYKVTATGDPAKLKIENRVLMDQIEKLKLE